MHGNNRLGRWRNAHATQWRGRTVLCAVQCAAQFRSIDFGRLALHERGLAAIHVHRAHAAFALTEVQRNTGKRAAGKDEQKNQRCELLLHDPIVTVLKSRNRCQASASDPRSPARNTQTVAATLVPRSRWMISLRFWFSVWEILLMQCEILRFCSPRGAASKKGSSNSRFRNCEKSAKDTNNVPN